MANLYNAWISEHHSYITMYLFMEVLLLKIISKPILNMIKEMKRMKITLGLHKDVFKDQPPEVIKNHL